MEYEGYCCPNPVQPTDTILLGHGSGGRLSHDLIKRLFIPEMGEAAPREMDDSATFIMGKEKVAFTTDSHVVSPLFFPGGDIGKLAVCGTVNDLAMVGAVPFSITCGFIIEEGLSLAILKRVVGSMREAAEEAEVFFAAGDTKVVQKGSADKLFINTAGLGRVKPGIDISGANAQEGDVLILSGPIGDHGITVLSAREGFDFETDLQSDVAPLNHLVAAMIAAGEVHVLRDPTRGGLATALYEIANQSNKTIEIYEQAIPIRPQVRAACEMLGFDPLYIANEGRLVAFVAEKDSKNILSEMKKSPYGQDVAFIGRVTGSIPQVRLKTNIGGTRFVDMLPGELLPRIC